MKRCPECGKWFQSLGYARHKAMHYERERIQKDLKEEKGTCRY